MSKASKPEVVVVTGASAGVGRATAKEFAKNGARVARVVEDDRTRTDRDSD